MPVCLALPGIGCLIVIAGVDVGTGTFAECGSVATSSTVLASTNP
jgi:hypothetical protein